MTPLVGFSDWTLALLPRLFLYPGGLWMLAALIALLVAMSGRESRRYRSLLHDLTQANLLALATAWAALSLLPLPGTQPLPFPADRLSLAALLALSMLFDGPSLKREHGIAGTAITLAIIAPMSGGQALLHAGATFALADGLSLLAVAAGLAALVTEGAPSLSGGVRWLGWLGLGAAPIWHHALISNALWASLVYAFAIGAIAWVSSVVWRRTKSIIPIGAALGLSAVSLLTALLAR
ncbi:MAG TPA: hypothetical protein VEX13_13495 [Chloroflexia bacterium]|nr:hypothetical protein [Chloroflexia bacterium]